MVVTYAGMKIGGDYVFDFYNFSGINIRFASDDELCAHTLHGARSQSTTYTNHWESQCMSWGYISLTIHTHYALSVIEVLLVDSFCSVIASLAYSYFKYREQQESQQQKLMMAEAGAAATHGGTQPPANSSSTVW